MATNSSGCAEFCAGCKEAGSFLGPIENNTKATVEFENHKGGNAIANGYITLIDEDGGETHSIDTRITASYDAPDERLEPLKAAILERKDIIRKRVARCTGMRAAIGCPALAEDVLASHFKDVQRLETD